MELEKVVKERDELKVKIEKWEESSKGLNKLLNSQMSAKDKNGLGYGTQLDEMSNKCETASEISMSVFEVRSSDEEITLANDRFSKADGYHDVPPPITDTSSHRLINPNEITYHLSKSKTNDEDDVSEANTKEGIGFKKIKACFVCKSTDHLIKDYDFYAKKSPEPKLKTMVNTGQRVVKPVWDNAKRVNHQIYSNKLKYPQARRSFVPSGVLTRTGLVKPLRPNGKRAVHTVSTARPISTNRPVSTARPFALKIAQTGSSIRPIYPRMDNVRPRASYSPIKRSYYTKPAFRPKNLKQDVKTSGVKNMTTAGTRAVVNTGKGKMDNALKKSRWEGRSELWEASQQITLLLRATYGAELVSAASLVNTARPTLSTARLVFMANLEFVDQHNMVTCLEKTEGNSDFHEIVYFLASSLIHHALTINATVDSKAVVVTEASIRSSLLFNDADEEGEGYGEPTEPQTIPSPTQPSTEDQPLETSSSNATTQDSRDSLEGTNGNEGDQSIKDAKAAEISALKSRIKKLEKKCKPSISHHRAWLKSVNRLSMHKRFGKESVSKHGRKKSKPESTLDDSTVFDDQDADHGIEYMETEEAVDEGMQSGETKEVKLTDDTKVVEEKGISDKGGNAEELVSTARPEVSTARPDIDAARQEDSAVEP
ncbi:hypothetical protein Tco_0216175 [Tanacetum coccineum]